MYVTMVLLIVMVAEANCYDDSNYFNMYCDGSCSFKCKSNEMNSRSGCYCDKRCKLLGDCCIEREVDCEGADPVNATNWVSRIMNRSPLPLSCQPYGDKSVKVVSDCTLTDANNEDVMKCREEPNSFKTMIPVRYNDIFYKNMYCVKCNHGSVKIRHLKSSNIVISCQKKMAEAYDIWNEKGRSAFYKFAKQMCIIDIVLPYIKDRLGMIKRNEEKRFECFSGDNDFRDKKFTIGAEQVEMKDNEIENNKIEEGQAVLSLEEKAESMCSKYVSSVSLSHNTAYKNIHCAIAQFKYENVSKLVFNYCDYIPFSKVNPTEKHTYIQDINTIKPGYVYSTFAVVINFFKGDHIVMNVGSETLCANHDMNTNECLNTTCPGGQMRIETLANSSHCVAYEDNSYKQMFSSREVELESENHTLVIVAVNGLVGDVQPLPINISFDIQTNWNNVGIHSFNYYQAVACNTIDHSMVTYTVANEFQMEYNTSVCYMYTVTTAYFHGYLNVESMSLSVNRGDPRTPLQAIFLNHKVEQLRGRNCSRNKPQLRNNIVLLGYNNGYYITRFRVIDTEQQYHVLHTPMVVSRRLDATGQDAKGGEDDQVSILSLVCEPRLLNCQTNTIAARNLKIIYKDTPSEGHWWTLTGLWSRVSGQSSLDDDDHRLDNENRGNDTMALLINIGEDAWVDVDGNEVALISGGSIVICKDRLDSLKNELRIKRLARRRVSMSETETVLSLMGTVVSIIAIAATLVTYAMFRPLRKGPGRSVMSLSASLLMGQIVYMLSPLGHLQIRTCEIIGIAYHYTWVATFLWMNVMAFDICMVFSSNKASRFTENIRFLLYSIYAWGLPFVLIMVCLTLDLTTHNITYGHTMDCFIDSKDALLYYFAMPILTVICLNIVLFGITVYSLRSTMKIAKQARPDGKRRSSLAIYARMTSLMGFTWLFGFLSNVHNLHFLTYPFIMFNTLQGLAIFVSFVMTKRARLLWKKRLQLLLHIDTYKEQHINPETPRIAANRKPNMVMSLRKSLQTRLKLDLTSVPRSTVTSCGSPTTPVRLILRNIKSPIESCI